MASPILTVKRNLRQNSKNHRTQRLKKCKEKEFEGTKECAKTKEKKEIVVDLLAKSHAGMSRRGGGRVAHFRLKL